MQDLQQNPRVLAIAVALIVVAGLSALTTIVRQEDPSITNGVAVIVTPYPGASAERVEALVTDKIEDELRELSEIQTLSSSSKNGVSVVTVELDEELQGEATEKAFSKIRDALDDATAQFPPGTAPPIFDDDRFGSYTRLLALRWANDDATPERGIMKRFGEELQDRLRDAFGTDSVKVFGAPSEEISVRFDADALAAAQLTAGQVAQALAQADAKVAAGAARSEANRVLIELTGELDSLARIRDVPVAVGAGGRVLRVGDLASVTRGVTDPPSDLAIVNGAASVVVAAQIAEGIAFDEWSSAADVVVARFAETLPHGIEMTTIFDQADYTRARLTDLIRNLATGLSLVVIVLFVTMGWRSAVIVSATLPLVSFASIAVLRLMSVPIHQMSVTGLIVALGLLVDNAIVVTDAIRERRLRGVSASQAVREAIGHLWGPLLSSTLTTVLAFMPILLLAGRVGEFVGAIGLSVIVALVSSYLIAMTIVPALASRLIRPSGLGTAGFWQTGLTLPIAGRWFERSIDWSLRHPRLSMLLAAVLPVLGLLGATTLPRQFFPPADRDQFYLEMRLPEQVAIEETMAVAAGCRIRDAEPPSDHGYQLVHRKERASRLLQPEAGAGWDAELCASRRQSRLGEGGPKSAAHAAGSTRCCFSTGADHRSGVAARTAGRCAGGVPALRTRRRCTAGSRRGTSRAHVSGPGHNAHPRDTDGRLAEAVVRYRRSRGESGGSAARRYRNADELALGRRGGRYRARGHRRGSGSRPRRR